MREVLRESTAEIIRAGLWGPGSARKVRRVLPCARAVHPEVLPDHDDHVLLAGLFVGALLDGDAAGLPGPLAAHVRRHLARG